MERHIRWAIFLVLGSLFAPSLALGPAPAAAQKKLTPKDLPLEFRKWLEEDVPFIISRKEREVFLQLGSDRERTMFIDAFWKQRDPTPETEENEFRTEHYRRISYSNQNFGRDAPGPGWRTDMGRIYILLGEPRQVQKYENLTEMYPVITWFYEGMAEYNLPGSFSVVFFKKSGIGTYELYSPVKDGPQSLLIHYMGDMASYEDAYFQLLQIEPQVADVSLSLIPGEARTNIAPSISSEILINSKVPAAPLVKVKDDYAEKLLRYKDVIDVDYTTNYITSTGLASVYHDASGLAFVHYLIEPEKLSLEEQPGKYHAQILVNGIVTDARGRTVYQFDRRTPIDLSPEQLTNIRAKLFSYQDLFPLIPGRYKFSVLWKNAVSRQFTSLEADLLVPEPDAFVMSDPVLANRVDLNSPYRGASKPFLVGGIQIVPSPRNDFLASDTLSVFVELRNVPADVRADGTISFTIVRGEEQVQSVVRNVRDYPNLGAVLEEFPLSGLPPAYYELRVAVLDAARAERVAAKKQFLITALPTLPRPWLLSVPLPPSSDPSYANIIGNQYFNTDDLAKARPLLESAARRVPSSPTYALDYARLLERLGDQAGVLAAAQPFLAGESKYDFLEVTGRAHQALGHLDLAIASFKDYLTHFGTNINILNAVGECYAGLGNNVEALVAWEKSLELNPNQPSLREKVTALKDKK